MIFGMIFLWKLISPGNPITSGPISGFMIYVLKFASAEIKDRLAVLYIIYILHDRITK